MLTGKAQEKEGIFMAGRALVEGDVVRDSNELVLQVPEGKKWGLGRLGEWGLLSGQDLC